MGSVHPLPDITRRAPQSATWQTLDDMRQWLETTVPQGFPTRDVELREQLRAYIEASARCFLQHLEVEHVLALTESSPLAGVFDELSAALALMDEMRAS